MSNKYFLVLIVVLLYLVAPQFALSQSCQNSSDCTDSSKPACVDGMCAPLPMGCQSDADCANVPGMPFCMDGVCSEAPLCEIDDDCPDPSSQICEDGVCTFFIPCIDDSNCLTPDKPVCENMMCVAPPACGETMHPVCNGECPEDEACMANDNSSMCQCMQVKVVICHKNKKTLNIDPSSVADHLDHGDSLGECEN